MGLFVSTTGTNVTIKELGITLTHPATDYNIGAQFSAEEVALAASLTTAIRNGTLVWKKTAGGSTQTPTDYDAQFLEVEDELAAGPGASEYQLIRVYGTPSANQVITWNATSTRWEAAPLGGINGGSGVTPPFFFSRSGGTLAAGTRLFTGNVSTQSTGQLVAGTNTIVKLSVSTSALIVGSTSRFQIQKRTGVATFTDITDAFIDIPVGQYKATRTGVSIQIGPDEELACYFKSGGSPSNPVRGVYLVPA